MENNSLTPTPEPTEPVRPQPVIHTYEDDLARAMDATEAPVVQEMLATAREREAAIKDEAVKNSQRKWYTTSSIALILIALACGAYGMYHYVTLTVPTEETISVGVFPSTGPISITSTDIKTLIKTFQTENILPEDKPHLVALVSDDKALTPLTKEELFTFMDATVSEPFIASFDSVRLGVVNTEREIIPFIIASTPDPEVASKEILIAEQKLLQLFYSALGINLETYNDEIGKEFVSTYLYNLPVRILERIDPINATSSPVLLYGYATTNTIVITSKPSALKAVYETIIRQR